MKRIISIVLAALMMVYLCACGGEKATAADVDTGLSDPETDASTGGESITDSITEGNTGAEDSETEAEPEKVELVVGQTHSFEKFDITIIGIEYTDDFDTRVDGLRNYGASKGNVFLNVYYTIKYNAKEAVTTTDMLPTQLNFDDGYLYSADAINRYFYYNPTSDEWYQSSSHIDGMSPELTYVVGIDVPVAVMNEKDKSLVLEFNIVGEEFTYTSRPTSDEAKEAAFTYGVNLLESENWDEVKLARDILFELGDYNNSSMVARLRWFTYDDREFFKNDASGLTPVSAEDITTVLSGNSFVTRSKYSERNITFIEDGIMDAKYTYNDTECVMYDSWRVEEGAVVLSQTNNGEVKEYRMIPYQFGDTYILVCSDGDFCDCSMLLTAAG